MGSGAGEHASCPSSMQGVRRILGQSPRPRAVRNVSQAAAWLPVTVARQAGAPPAGHFVRLQRHTPPLQPTARVCPAHGRHASAATCRHAPGTCLSVMHAEQSHDRANCLHHLRQRGVWQSRRFTLQHWVGRKLCTCCCSSWCRASLPLSTCAPPPLPLEDASQMCTRSTESAAASCPVSGCQAAGRSPLRGPSAFSPRRPCTLRKAPRYRSSNRCGQEGA